jgi:hypothetical protein
MDEQAAAMLRALLYHVAADLLYILIHRTSLSALPTAVSLSSIIRETPQNYNNYIQAFR